MEDRISKRKPHKVRRNADNPSVKVRSSRINASQAQLEVEYYQRTTDLLIKKIPFARVVREIVMDIFPDGIELYWKSTALLALQEAAEWYLVCLFQDANLCARHAKRVTVTNDDLALVRRLTERR